jgi:uncharacterized membrane-anchored protein YjiN (DUF445 family)
MKAFATGLLLAMTVLFLITRAIEDGHSGISYVRAFAEAGMVGALADWFAVTALFKHPLGLPIPHTAIIPTRKDDIGRGLGTFVQGNFLSGPVLGERLASIGVADKVGQWLADRHNAEQLAANAGDVVEAVTEVLSDEDVASAVQDMVDARLRAIPAAPLASRVLDAAVENGQHRVMLDSLLKGTSRAVEHNRDLLRIQLGNESPWWVPDAVDDRVFDKLYSSLNNFLGDVAADPDHAVRRQMDERIRLLVDELRDSPEMAARGEELKAQLLDNPAVRQWSGRLWGELKVSLVGAAADPESELRRRLVDGIVRLGDTIQTDPELRAKIDGWVERTVDYLVQQYGHEVADLISSTVEKWDADDASRRIELQVGRDLQFIRINGTVVGGLAGVVIYAVGHGLFG